MISFHKSETSRNENKNAEGFIAVDLRNGLILAKTIRTTATGSVLINGEKFHFENYGLLRM